jgi:hypothetical protein
LLGRIWTAGSCTGDGFGAVFRVDFVVFAAFAGFAETSSCASENLLFNPGSALMRADALRSSTMINGIWTCLDEELQYVFGYEIELIDEDFAISRWNRITS